jgi:uncharacterized protein
MPTAHSRETDRERAREIAERGLILRTTVGSVVHGLSNPGTDDRDELGICVEPPEYLPARPAARSSATSATSASG